jgi:MFS family permease
VLSAGLLLTLRGRRLERPRTGRVSVRDGVRFVAGHPLLRPLTLYLGVNNACTQALVTGLVAYLSVGRPRGAGLVGLAVGGYGLGFLLGAVAAPAVIRRFGTPGSVVGSSLLSATGAGVVAVGAAMQSGPMTVTAAVVGAVGVGVAGPIFNVPSVTLRLAVTPAELLGRVTAVVKLVSQGGLPVGALAGGLLVAGLPPVVAFGTIAGVSLLATLLLVGLPSEVG